MATDPEKGNGPASAAAAITNAVVAIFREHYGRGPIKAKTYLFDDYVLTVLHETMTTAERTLVDAGREEQVREFRLAFQKAKAVDFKSAVQEITGRRVRTYQSQIAFNPECCFEFFWLEPEGTI